MDGCFFYISEPMPEAERNKLIMILILWNMSFGTSRKREENNMSVQIHFINPNKDEDMERIVADLLAALAVKKLLAGE